MPAASARASGGRAGAAKTGAAKAGAATTSAALAAAIAAFERGRFQRALSLLRAERARAERAGAGAARATRARVELWLGVVNAALGNNAAARTAFGRALALDAGLTLDAERFKPEIVSMLAEVRRAKTGLLVVIYDLPGATVHLDGHRLGVAPQRRRLAPGRYRVALRDRRGALVSEQPVTIEAGRTLRLAIRNPDSGHRPSVAGPAQPAPPRRRRLWTWIAAGSAAAALAVGIGLGAAAKADYDEYLATDDLARYQTLRDRIPTRATVANVMFGAAGVLAAGAAVLFFLEGHAARAERARGSGSRRGRANTLRTSGALRVVPGIAASGPGLLLRGAF